MDYLMWPLLCIFLLPILYYVEMYSLDLFKAKEILRSLLYMFWFGFAFAICSTYWFLATYPLDGLNIHSPILSIVIIGGVWMCFGVALSLPLAAWILVAFVFKKARPLTAALVGACAWVILEYARSWLVALAVYGSETLFGPHHTYYSMAYPLSAAPIAKELLPVGGIYLASFVIILTNYLIYHTIRMIPSGDHADRISTFKLGGLIICMLSISAGGMHLIRNENDSQTTFQAAIITTNLPSGTQKDIKEDVALNAVNSISNKDALIFLPENINILAPYLQKRGASNTSLYNDHLIVGSFSDEKFSNIFFLNPRSGEVAYSGKQLLMPVGEYNINWVTFLLRKTQSAEWMQNYERSLHASNKHTPTFVFNDNSKNDLRIAGTLCSENISPYIYRDATNLGATVLINLASHAPFRGSPLLSRQTIGISATRALENGRYYIAASNDTRSFVITDQGIIQQISDSKATFSHFNALIQTKNYMTPYVLFGDYFVVVCCVLLMLAFIWRERVLYLPNIA